MRSALLGLAGLVIVFSAVAADGCYLFCSPDTYPRQVDAFEIVRDAYRPLLGTGVDSAKVRLEWSTTMCPHPAADGEMRTAVIHNGKCYDGLTFLGGVCQIAWRGSFSSSAYAHELMHALLNATGRGGWVLDEYPAGTEYPPGTRDCPECRELVEEANARLRAAGL